MNKTDLNEIQDKVGIIDAFFLFAQKEQKREAEELINEENLNVEAAKRYILVSLKRGYASENGTELSEILPRMSPLNSGYLTKKQTVFQKISAFVEKFKGVGGKLQFNVEYLLDILYLNIVFTVEMNKDIKYKSQLLE